MFTHARMHVNVYVYTDEYEGNDWFTSLEASKKSVEGLTSILAATDNNEDVDAMARESVYEGVPNVTFTENCNISVNDNENEEVGENKSVEMNFDEGMLENNEYTTQLNQNKAYISMNVCMCEGIFDLYHIFLQHSSKIKRRLHIIFIHRYIGSTTGPCP